MTILYVIIIVSSFIAMVLRSRILKLRGTFLDTFLSILFLLMLMHLLDDLMPGHGVLSFIISAVIYALTLVWLNKNVPEK